MQPLSLQQLLDRSRAAGQALPVDEAALLFAAAVRLAVEQGAPLKASRLVLLPGGAVALAARDEGEDRPGSLAPELSSADPPRRTEGRVQVFAAGALGYELLCGRPPPEPPALPGPELQGPLADVVRVALSADRRERFGDLQQLLDAIEVVQPRDLVAWQRPLSVLFERAARWEAIFSWPAVAGRLDQLQAEVEQLSGKVVVQEQALARLPDLDDLVGRMADLEAALVALRSQQQAAQGKLAEALQKAQAARSVAEQRAQEEVETREAFAALHPPRPAWVAALLPALLGGCIGAGAVAAFFVLGGEHAAAPGRGAAAPVTAAGSALPAHPAPGPAPAPDGAASAQAEGGREGAAGDAALLLVRDGGVRDAVEGNTLVDAGATSTLPGAGAGAGAGAADADAGADAGAFAAAAPATPGKAGAGSGSAASLSPARMARAVARSQVVRGDNALEKGRADEAIEQFRIAIENDPELAEAHRGLGMAYALRNLDVQARREYERYLALAPNAEDAGDIRRAIAELSSRSKLGDGEK